LPVLDAVGESRAPRAEPETGVATLPLVVAVTGHRALVPSEIETLRHRTRELFRSLGERYPTNRLTIVSPLAEGADLLVAEVALEESLELIVPLPKPRDMYLADFTTEEARRRFQTACEGAQDVFVLASDRPPAPEGVSNEVWEDQYPYAQLGAYLSAHCHVLLALWDGQPSSHLGGTAQVIKFHLDEVMPGVTPATAATQQVLVDDESDLVFHIVCSRTDRDDSPAPGLTPGACYWYTNDASRPRSPELPEQHEVIFARTAEFGRDALRHVAEIEAESASLVSGGEVDGLPPGINAIDRLFRCADWLAIHYQRKTLRALRAVHGLAFLMGLMFLLYSDFESWRYFMIAFLAFFAVALGIHAIARRGGWHRKYIDYRTLAEGLRVQFYWAAAGVTSEMKWRFAHDAYLRSQDPQCGWIRNVMRVAGFRCDARPNEDPSGVAFAVREWVGDAESGQLGYFRRKAHDRSRRHALTEAIGYLSLWVSVGTVAAFVLIGSALPPGWSRALTVVMGTCLLIFAMRTGYASATAVEELIRQYEFMLRIFGNAHRRLSGTDDIVQQRRILSGLGQSALDEHSDWLLMHRERLFAKSAVWRMSG
jgi:hypothetical protein